MQNDNDDYSALQKQLNLQGELPYSPGWSAAPDFMRLIVDYVLENKSQQIVECSSGLTTLMLARCCQINGSGHVYSLENGAEYAQKTRDAISVRGLHEFATVIDAPLQAFEIDEQPFQWYELDGLPQLKIDMLVVDGPPGYLQRQSRYPALPLLHWIMSKGCKVFLDDAARPDEQAIVSRWLKEFPALSHRFEALERGGAVLTLHQAG